MLGSSYHFQDHCLSRQVFALSPSYANYPPILDNSAFYRQNSNKTFFFFGPIPLIAHSTQNHIKKRTFGNSASLFHIFDHICLISLSVCTVKCNTSRGKTSSHI